MRKTMCAVAAVAAIMFSSVSFASNYPLDMQIAVDSVSVEQSGVEINQEVTATGAVELSTVAVDRSFSLYKPTYAAGNENYQSVDLTYRHEDPHRMWRSA